jgi:hypothetical protein
MTAIARPLAGCPNEPQGVRCCFRSVPEFQSLSERPASGRRQPFTTEHRNPATSIDPLGNQILRLFLRKRLCFGLYQASILPTIAQ